MTRGSPPKYPGVGKAYACPKCDKPMVPDTGPYDVWHCFPCMKSVDLWWSPVPKVVDRE